MSPDKFYINTVIFWFCKIRMLSVHKWKLQITWPIFLPDNTSGTYNEVTHHVDTETIFSYTSTYALRIDQHGKYITDAYIRNINIV